MDGRRRSWISIAEDSWASSSAGSDDGAASTPAGLRDPSLSAFGDLSMRLEGRDSVESNDFEERPRKRVRRVFSHVAVNGPEFPRSAYGGWVPATPVIPENDAILELKAALNEKATSGHSSPEYTYFTLDEFSVYRPDHERNGHQLSSLDRLQNREGCNEFFFDGILTAGRERRRVQGIPFQILAVDGYGDPDVTDIRDHICIQSRAALNWSVWYRLGKPAAEYCRFHEPFLYLAQFTKYFVDYLLEHKDVALRDFRSKFYTWLAISHSGQPEFQCWLAICNNLRDFRTTVTANVGFLWKECHSIDDAATGLVNHQIWGEVDPRKLTAIPAQPVVEKQTIVTPFAYNCFRRSYFAAHLEPRDVSDRELLAAVEKRKQALKLLPFSAESRNAPATPRSILGSPRNMSSSIREGDVISITPDTNGKWRSAASVWYAYVQHVRTVNGNTTFDVLWLYDPRDTTLGNAYYPFDNELFLSDNCDCGEAAVDAACVIEKVEVTWYLRDPSSSTGLFVRQKYRTSHDQDTYDFVSIQKSDFKCDCRKERSGFQDCLQNFALGDNVLFREYNQDLEEERLEPAQIVDILLERKEIILRRMRRRKEFDAIARPNELEMTKDLFRCSPKKVIRKCHIRFFDAGEVLPFPYNADGASDFFYIRRTSNHDRTHSHETILAEEQDKLPPLREGWDPRAAPTGPKMRGMGIFCGGGNLDRGLEDGGAVEFQFAIDYAEHALHSYRANVEDPDRVQFFLGSVDDYLAQALAGSTKSFIARIGDVEVLSAGSPCLGFSSANMRKNDPLALRNASMVASVVSYVDFYSPKQCVLENVVPMTQGMGINKDENVFAQILAALVAMGYQVQQFLMDAWSFSSSQQRTRVFIVASAPGIEPVPPPPYTHDHPPAQCRSRSLGKSSNGSRFGLRRDDTTPFKHISPLQATYDLPNIGDSLPQLCPAFPDHKVPMEESNVVHSCIALVPVYPRGAGFVQTIRQGEQARSRGRLPWCSPITGLPMEFYETKIRPNKNRGRERSKVFARVDPQKLFPTFLTTLLTQDSINGPSLHWDEARCLSVMEARRGQGFLDHEIIVGSPRQQMKIIGNSVDRKVSLALGLALRESWLMATSDISLHNSNSSAFLTRIGMVSLSCKQPTL